MYAQAIVATSVVIASLIAFPIESATGGLIPVNEISAIPVSTKSDKIYVEPITAALTHQEIPVEPTYKIEVIPYTEEDLRCMAENLYFESRGEPHAGQIAVGLVTMNRVHSPEYPDTVCEVVYQKINKVCQFSWFCDKYPDVIRNEEAWDLTVELSRKILNNEFYDITEGATYFHADYVSPRWRHRLIRTVTIDRHIFYRDPKDVYKFWGDV